MEQAKKIDKILGAVESLAIRMDSYDKRFDQQDGRFDQHDKRFDQHDKRFDQQDKRFDQQDKKINTLVDTVENLAIMMKGGFEQMATKEDIRNLSEGLDIVKADVSDIKMTLKPLDQTVSIQDKEIDELKIRVDKIEDKVFAV
jgi:chromosome segregation ATPase